MRVYSRKVGKLLREKRLNTGPEGLTLKEASAILGFSPIFLAKVERGGTVFSPSRFKLAANFYKIEMKELIEAAVEDYRDSLKKFISEHNEI